ncbi:HesB/IscA family protein, partial [Streptomyces cyaneofuscatus]
MSVSDETTTVSDGILLSDAAAAKVKGLLEQEGREDLALRVAVQPGGCSGLRYQLFFDERSLDGDVVNPGRRRTGAGRACGQGRTGPGAGQAGRGEARR